jgi:hypothetical protein
MAYACHWDPNNLSLQPAVSWLFTQLKSILTSQNSAKNLQSLSIKLQVIRVGPYSLALICDREDAVHTAGATM